MNDGIIKTVLLNAVYQIVLNILYKTLGGASNGITDS